MLAISAVLFYALAKTDPVHERRAKSGSKPVSAMEQLAPLKNIQVWRFATYYFFVFGAFVALASFLPRYYVGAYGLGLTTAGVLAGLYSLPGSVFRALGGWMSDKFGARWVMYFTFMRVLGRALHHELPEHGPTRSKELTGRSSSSSASDSSSS